MINGEFIVMEFVTILLLVFGLCMVIAGAFTAYFGSGKSRIIGAVLLIIGFIVGFVWGYGAYLDSLGPLEIQIELSNLLWGSFLVILAAVIGALAAVGLFLLAIMKS